MTSDPVPSETFAKPALASDKTRAGAGPVRAQALLDSVPDEQIGTAIAAEKWARAADLLEFHGERLLLDGGVRELTGWLEALPEPHVSRNPRVAALFAWVRIYDQRYQDALHCLSQAERALQQLRLGEAGRTLENDEVDLRPFAELEQSLAAIRLHVQAVAGPSAKLPAQVEDIMLPASGDHPMWRAGALVILGRSRYLAGDLRGASDDLEAAEVLASSSTGLKAARVGADAAVLRGRIAEALGDLAGAKQCYQELSADLREAIAPARLAGEVGLARVALARLEVDVASGHLDQVRAAQQIVGSDGPPAADPVRVVLEGELVRAQLLAIEGAFDDARVVLDQLEKTLAAQKIRWPLELIGAQRARIALLKRDESQARRWRQQYGMRVDSRVPPRSPIAAYEKVTEALVEVAMHDPRPALQAAREVLACAEETGHRQLGQDALVALCLAHYGAGNRDDSRAALRAAIEAAQTMGGALLPFIVRGLDLVAAELGVEDEGLAQAIARTPALPRLGNQHAERLPARPSNGGGPIETSQVSDAPGLSSVPGAEAEEAAPPSDAEAAVPDEVNQSRMDWETVARPGATE